MADSEPTVAVMLTKVIITPRQTAARASHGRSLRPVSVLMQVLPEVKRSLSFGTVTQPGGESTTIAILLL
ncbi:hypothetical protein GCM10010434_019230 [Winogradskya humida]